MPRITPEIADIVLDRMSNGEILNAIAPEFGLAPNSFTSKAAREVEFGERYARARADQAHALAADVVRIADEEPDPQKARVRCDARKWLAARIDPKNYGDRHIVDHRHTLDAAEVDYPELLAIAQGRLEPPTIEHEATDIEPSDLPSRSKKRKKKV